MHKQIFQFIGFMVVANMVLDVTFSLIGKIPAVKRFNEKKAIEYRIAYEDKKKIFKEELSSKFTLQPLQNNYGELLYAYSDIQIPVVGVAGIKYQGQSFTYETKSRCEFARKTWSFIVNEDLSCSPPKLAVKK